MCCSWQVLRRLFDPRVWRLISQPLLGSSWVHGSADSRPSWGHSIQLISTGEQWRPMEANWDHWRLLLIGQSPTRANQNKTPARGGLSSNADASTSIMWPTNLSAFGCLNNCWASRGRFKWILGRSWQQSPFAIYKWRTGKQSNIYIGPQTASLNRIMQQHQQMTQGDCSCK